MKLWDGVYYWPAVLVAPHAGAWIETGGDVRGSDSHGVAPHAGAWIETTPMRSCAVYLAGSPPTRGRGLKRGGCCC